MKITKATINSFLPSKRYFTHKYTANARCTQAKNKENFGVYAIKNLNGKLIGHDSASNGGGVPGWVYYGKFDFDAGKLIEQWMLGEIDRAEVVAGIQAGLEAEAEDEE